MSKFAERGTPSNESLIFTFAHFQLCARFELDLFCFQKTFGSKLNIFYRTRETFAGFKISSFQIGQRIKLIRQSSGFKF